MSTACFVEDLVAKGEITPVGKGVLVQFYFKNDTFEIMATDVDIYEGGHSKAFGKYMWWNGSMAHGTLDKDKQGIISYNTIWFWKSEYSERTVLDLIHQYIKTELEEAQKKVELYKQVDENMEDNFISIIRNE